LALADRRNVFRNALLYIKRCGNERSDVNYLEMILNGECDKNRTLLLKYHERKKEKTII